MLFLEYLFLKIRKSINIFENNSPVIITISPPQTWRSGLVVSPMACHVEDRG